MRFTTPWGATTVRLAVRGDHQLSNAAAALAAAVCAGVPLEAAAEGLAGATGSAGRSQRRTSATGLVVLDDAYNANPTSMAAALRALAAMPGGRRVAVLGPMAELGEEQAAAHRAMGDLAADLGIEVVAVGTTEYGVAAVADQEAALDALADLGAGDVVLVKASRSAGLDRLVERLCGGTEAA